MDNFETISLNFVKSYQGELSPDETRYHGLGEIQYISGNTYSGQFEMGMLDGHGVYTWRDGVTFQGEFRNNKISGAGAFDWNNGSNYEGEVLNGFRHGFGIFEAQKGKQYYEGNWKNGKTDGLGTCRYEFGGHYSGDWRDGKKHGKGTMVYASGNVYEGEWVENVRAGHGKMSWKAQKESYEGDWQNGKPHGYGVYTWLIDALRDHQFPTHNVYKGQWQHGMRHGTGTFYYSNGSKYEGEWRENAKHGKGKYTTNNGRVYDGLFEDDQMTEPFQPFHNRIPYEFHLPESPIPRSQVLVELNSIIARNIDNLRQLYHNCCLGTKKMNSEHGSKSLNRRTIWHLYRSTKITQKGFSLADLDRFYSKHFKNDLAFGDRFQDPHNPETEFIFHDLLEHLILTACLLYGDIRVPTTYQSAIAASFAFFLKEHILKATEIETSPIPLELDEKCFSIFDKMENANRNLMYDLYGDICHKTKKSLATSVKDNTLLFREFCFMLKNFHFFDNYKHLTMKKLVPQFAVLLPIIENSGCINLEYEMVLYDFRKSFTAAARLALTPLIDQYKGSRSKDPEPLPTSQPVEPVVQPAAPSAARRRSSVDIRPQSTKSAKRKVPPNLGSAVTGASIVESEVVEEDPKPLAGNRPKSSSFEAAAPPNQADIPIDQPNQEILCEIEVALTKFYRQLFDSHKEHQYAQRLISTSKMRKAKETAVRDAVASARRKTLSGKNERPVHLSSEVVDGKE
ncbi:hypothetical protein HDU91_005637 [Kappamyces sp. JEL0680]|nr:hypothetical protein HDU91_005637 [Kappamyces sp. JEL0680]